MIIEGEIVERMPMSDSIKKIDNQDTVQKIMIKKQRILKN